MNCRPLLVSLLLVPALCAATQADPPAGVDGARSIPATAYGYVEFAGLDACQEAAAAMGLLDLVAGLVPAARGDSADQLLQREVVPQLERALAEVGVSRAELHAVLREPVVCGISRPTFIGDLPLPSVVLGLRGGEVGEQLVGSFRQIAGARAPAPQTRSREVAGVRIDEVRSGRDNGGVATAVVGGWAFAANNPAFLADVVRTVRGRAPALADVPGFAAARGQHRPLLDAWVNVGPFWDALQLVLPYEAEPILAALGVQRVNGLHLSLATLETAGRDVLHVSVDHTEDGLLAALLPHGAHRDAARFCSPNVLFTQSQTIDPAALVRCAGDLVDALPGAARAAIPAAFHARLAGELGDGGGEPQRALEVVRALGPELTLAVSMPGMRGGAAEIVPGALAFVGARDAGLGARLIGFLRGHGARIDAVDFDGHRLWYTTVTLGGVRLSPSLAQVGERLVFSSELRRLKSAIRRAADPAEPSLADTADYQRHLLRHEGATSLQVLRVREHLAGVYGRVRPMLVGVLDRNPQLGVSGDDLPLPEHLRGVLADVVHSVDRNPRGVTLTTEGSLTFATLLANVGAVAARLLTTGGERGAVR